MTNPEWVTAGTLAELTTQPRRVSRGDLHAFVAIVDGEPYAVADVCLHKGASLVGGICRDGTIACPEHWWRYSMTDGSLQGSSTQRLATYPCRIEGDHVQALLPEAPPQASILDILLAHARSGQQKAADRGDAP